MRLEVEGLGRLRKIRKEDKTEDGDGQGDDSIQYERLSVY
jgi:hypothetical protein